MIWILFVSFIVLLFGQLTGMWSIALNIVLVPLYLIALLVLVASLMAVWHDLWNEHKHRGDK
ncbi:hypothetical protein DIS16_00980 [Levilactobacillus brevis]|nr:hypothetical protein DIS16_00980 [Levilactobacillus brevis]